MMVGSPLADDTSRSSAAAGLASTTLATRLIQTADGKLRVGRIPRDCMRALEAVEYTKIYHGTLPREGPAPGLFTLARVYCLHPPRRGPAAAPRAAALRPPCAS